MNAYIGEKIIQVIVKQINILGCGVHYKHIRFQTIHSRFEGDLAGAQKHTGWTDQIRRVLYVLKSRHNISNFQ